MQPQTNAKTGQEPLETITSSGFVILALQPLSNLCRKFPVVADVSIYYNMHSKCTESIIQSRALI